MKHAREDYNRIQDPDGKIPADEPVFLLRGQDVLAPETLRTWANMLRFRYKDDEMANMVEKHAHDMVAWQKEHGASIPDLPGKEEQE